MIQDLIEQYAEAVKAIYGSNVRQIILYGSYARGDFCSDSDVDIMILVDMSALELKAYAQQLSYMTYDFNMDYGTDIKPIVKSEAHFNKYLLLKIIKEPITEHTILFFMQLMQYMLSAVKHIKDIKMLWRISIRIM